MSFYRQDTEYVSEGEESLPTPTGRVIPREDSTDPIEEFDESQPTTVPRNDTVQVSQYGLSRTRRTREESIMEYIEDMKETIAACGNKALDAQKNIAKYSNSTMSTADSEDLLMGKFDLETALNELNHVNAVVQQLKEELQDLFCALRQSM